MQQTINFGPRSFIAIRFKSAVAMEILIIKRLVSDSSVDMGHCAMLSPFVPRHSVKER